MMASNGHNIAKTASGISWYSRLEYIFVLLLFNSHSNKLTTISEETVRTLVATLAIQSRK
jgi:hypothetical protein